MWSLGILNQSGFWKCLLYCFDTFEGLEFKGRIEREFFLECTIDPLGKSIVGRLATLSHTGENPTEEPIQCRARKDWAQSIEERRTYRKEHSDFLSMIRGRILKGRASFGFFQILFFCKELSKLL